MVPIILINSIISNFSSIKYYVVYISISVLEVLFFRKFFLSQGLIFSIPLIYLVNNIMDIYSNINAKPTKLENIGLTKKELEVTNYLKQGKTNKEIAYEMGVKPNTVKNHIYNIFKKTNSSNRIEFLGKIGQIY